MDQKKDKKVLRDAAYLIQQYFIGHKRELPWRETPPVPYHVWVSEIMLQQTRIETVIPYYRRFIEAAPDIAALAAMPEEKLLKLWEGLGYYSRARHLHEAARAVCERFAGVLPDRYDVLLTLPGIGAYTAGAIASIAFGEPVPAVDGNVLRLCARLTEHTQNVLLPQTRRYFFSLLSSVYPKESPGTLTQGMMELGQRVCTPKNPDCAACPLNGLCRAYRHGSVASFPVREKNQTRKVQEPTVFLLYDNTGRIALVKRPDTGLLAGLYGFPNTQNTLSEQEAIDFLSGFGLGDITLLEKRIATHIFTHITWRMTGYVLSVQNAASCFVWAEPTELTARYALPTAFKKLLTDHHR